MAPFENHIQDNSTKFEENKSIAKTMLGVFSIENLSISHQKNLLGILNTIISENNYELTAAVKKAGINKKPVGVQNKILETYAKLLTKWKSFPKDGLGYPHTIILAEYLQSEIKRKEESERINNKTIEKAINDETTENANDIKNLFEGNELAKEEIKAAYSSPKSIARVPKSRIEMESSIKRLVKEKSYRYLKIKNYRNDIFKERNKPGLIAKAVKDYGLNVIEKNIDGLPDELKSKYNSLYIIWNRIDKSDRFDVAEFTDETMSLLDSIRWYYNKEKGPEIELVEEKGPEIELVEEKEPEIELVEKNLPKMKNNDDEVDILKKKIYQLSDLADEKGTNSRQLKKTLDFLTNKWLPAWNALVKIKQMRIDGSTKRYVSILSEELKKEFNSLRSMTESVRNKDEVVKLTRRSLSFLKKVREELNQMKRKIKTRE